MVDAQSGTLKLRARIDSEHSARLRPGMFVTARIITASRDRALLVKRKAVFYDDEKPAFFLIGDEDRVRKVHFRPAATTEDALEIDKVLEEDIVVATGDRIVLVGQDNLKDGEQVEIVKENP